MKNRFGTRFAQIWMLVTALLLQLGCTNSAQEQTLVAKLQLQAAPAGSADWMMNAGYGVMVHWTSQSRPQSGAAPSAYCTAVNNFNVNTFAQQLQNSGAGYVIFTVSHAQQFFAFPSAKLDSVIAGRTCTRDLYADLFAAINPKGIKMVFYYPSVGTDEDPAWRDASKFNSDPTYFAQLQYDLVEEIGNRYGNKLAGWWVDNCYDSAPVYTQFGSGRGARYNFTTYAQKLRSGNPNRLVTFNFTYNQWNSTTGQSIVDYAAGEDDVIGRLPSSRFSGEGNTQWHNLVWMDDFWVHKDATTPAPRYSDAVVNSHIQSVMNQQGVFSYNAAPYQDSLIASATMTQLQNINATIHNSKIDDRNSSLIYSSGWGDTTSANYSNGTGRFSVTSGSNVQYTFSGTGIKWYGVVGNDHGKADVFIDNVLDATIDLYTTHWAANTIVYAKRGLSNGSHTIKIVVRSDRNTASSNNYVEIDALEALDAPVQSGTKTDDRSSSISYSSGWSQYSNASYHLGTTTFSTLANSQVQYPFSGSSISWYGVKSSEHGKADVFIDNVLESTVDLYSAVRSTGLVYSKSGLSSGAHTIKIVVRSDRNPSATANYVEVDAFEAGAVVGSTTKLDDRATQVSYVGTWSQFSNNSYFNNTTTFTTSAGLVAQLSFTGSSIKWFGVSSSEHGKVDVFIDDILDSTVDLYSVTRSTGVVYTKSGLASGSHTIKIVVRSDRNVSATSNYVEVDAFEFN
jgi:alpha-L-fucosidase